MRRSPKPPAARERDLLFAHGGHCILGKSPHFPIWSSAIRLFEELASIDPLLRGFEKTIRQRGKYVQIPVPLQIDELAKLFAKGVNRRDLDRSIISELGFAVGFTTPGKSNAWLTIHCGVYDSPGSANGCFLHLYFQGDDYERVVREALLVRILRAMVDAFEPAVGNAGFSSFWEAVAPGGARRAKELEMDWIMYFSREWGAVPPLPAPVRIEPVGKLGTLIILTPERVSAANHDHVELGRRVRTLLEKANLMYNRLTD